MKILDGGFGTTLRDNFGIRDTEVWSLRPIIDGNYDLVKRCHQLHIEAGCHVIITGNYCATPYYLEKIGGDEQLLPEYISKIGEIANNLKKDHPIEIAGSIPPYSESYNPNKETSENQLQSHYLTTFNNLNPYVDFFIAETIASSREAKLIYQAYQTYQNQILDKNNDIPKPLYLSFCIKSDGITLLDETTLVELLQDIEYKIEGIMFNCSPLPKI